MLLSHFRFVADACSELNLRQANYLSSIFYLKFRFFYTIIFFSITCEYIPDRILQRE